MQPADMPTDNFSDRVFILTPEADIEVNLFHWLRLSGTIAYHYLQDLDLTAPLTHDELSGLSTGLALRFGIFGQVNFDSDNHPCH